MKYILVISLLLLVALPLASQTSLSADALLLQDIKSQRQPERYTTLLAGEREFVVVTQESNLPNTKGVVVLVGESYQNPFNQQALGNLATQLNDFGWTTKVIAASAFATNAQDTNTGNQAQQDSHAKSGLVTLTKQSFDAQQQQLQLQINALQPEIDSIIGFKVVVGQGTSAAWLGKLYAEKLISLPDAFVALSAFWPEPKFNQQLPELFAKTEMPLLDIYSSWDNKWSLYTHRQRKIAASKAFKLHYRQRELPYHSINRHNTQRLAKEIYGWLTNMGW